MRKILSVISFLVASSAAFAQGAHDFKLNEVYVYTPACCQGDSTKTCGQQASYVDEYGQPTSWIEIENISYSTHDIRNCFLTINPAVLDKTMSAPEREKLMSLISAGDPRTSLAAKQRITFFADGKTNRGTLHLNFTLPVNESFTIYLFDGNAVDLLDSVHVEALPVGTSYARINDAEWQVLEANKVTPNGPNVEYRNDKIKEFKEKDPHGIAMTLMCMGVVFSCLVLLFVFFHIFGWAMNRAAKLARVRAIRAIHEKAAKVVEMAKQGTTETKGVDMETYTAVIGLALHEYFGGTHDLESGILTINQTPTTWADKSHELRTLPQIHPAN
ncbi:MAG: OadG family protein [Bacteroidaceae bacterium]|nr:OadG family protein [Bacteroidaceae bacterium]